MVKLPEDSGYPAFVAQRIGHLTTDQEVGGSSPSKRTELLLTNIPNRITKDFSVHIPFGLTRNFRLVLSLSLLDRKDLQHLTTGPK